MTTRLRRGVLSACAQYTGAPAPAAVVGVHQEAHDFGDGAGPYSHTAAIGAADSTRIVGVALYAGGTSGTITSVVIGGVSATPKITNAATTRLLEYWEAPVPTGTTATIVVTVSTAGTRCAIDVFTVTGQPVPGATAVSGSGAPTGSAAAQSLPVGPITVPAGGLIIGAAMHNTSTIGGDISWAQSSGTGTRYANEVVGAGPWWSTYMSAQAGSITLTPSHTQTADFMRALSVAYG